MSDLVHLFECLIPASVRCTRDTEQDFKYHDDLQLRLAAMESVVGAKYAAYGVEQEALRSYEGGTPCWD